MSRNRVLIFVIIVLNGWVWNVLGQSKRAKEEIDFSNIFCARYTHVGIPAGDSVYFYRPTAKTASASWSSLAQSAIPNGAIAIDGNIRKNIFLTKEGVIFEESGRNDTLHFNSELPPTSPRLWIRTPHSTETDCYFLSGEKNVCYYQDYDEAEKRLKWYVSDQLNPYIFKENRMEPTLNDQDGFDKLYSFSVKGGAEYIAAVFKHQISFHRYPLVQDSLLSDIIIEPVALNFLLPEGTLTAFVYDYRYIAVVSQEQIDFYDFDKEQKKWIPYTPVPPLRFREVFNASI